VTVRLLEAADALVGGLEWLGRTETLLADAGYFSGPNVEACVKASLLCLAASPSLPASS
jgi:hypothetical protein